MNRMTTQKLIQALTDDFALRIRELCADDTMDCDNLCAGNILTAKCIVFQAAERLSSLQSENVEKDKEIKRLSALLKAREGGPCGLCRYSPPSSRDGKPCTMCPAEAALSGGGGDDA